MRPENQHPTYQDLLATGAATDFRMLKEQIIPGPDEAEFGCRIEISLGADDNTAEETVRTTGLGFMFTIAALSFADARARGMSEADFRADDELTVFDFIHGLSFDRGILVYEADYLRGRRVKTDIALDVDGHVTLSTFGRGNTPLRWLNRLQGRKSINVVAVGDH